MSNNVHELLAHPRSLPSLALRPDTPNLRLFLTGPDGASHIVTMRSTFSIEGDRLSRESVHAFYTTQQAWFARWACSCVR